VVASMKAVATVDGYCHQTPVLVEGRAEKVPGCACYFAVELRLVGLHLLHKVCADCEVESRSFLPRRGHRTGSYGLAAVSYQPLEA
jgi:hypothetical protein